MMNTDPVTSASQFTQEEKNIATSLKPELILCAINGSNNEDIVSQYSYDMAVIDFLKLLNEARKSIVNHINTPESSLIYKVSEARVSPLELIYAVKNVLIPLASKEMLDEQNLFEEPVVLPSEKYDDAVDFIYECEKLFPMPISVVERWD